MRRRAYELVGTRQDNGFFGPGSMPWRLADHPCLIPSSIYQTLMFELYPPCALLSDSVDSLYRDPVGRARRTLSFIYVTIFGDTATAYRAAAFVRRLHDPIEASCPLTGETYRVDDPDNLLWLHMTTMDGLLRSHAAYGIGRLSRVELDRCWAEFVPFAELQGVPRGMVPASAVEADEYFAAIKPKLALTAPGRRAIKQVLHPALPGASGLVLGPALRGMVDAGYALLDDDLRELLDASRNALTTAPSIFAARALLTALDAPGGRDLLPRAAGSGAPDVVRQAREIQAAWGSAPRADSPRVDLESAAARAFAA